MLQRFLMRFWRPSATSQQHSSDFKQTINRMLKALFVQYSNIHIAVCPAGEVPETLGKLRESSATTRQKAEFILATNGEDFQAEDLASGEPVVCCYKDFPDHFGFFLPLAGISTLKWTPADSTRFGATCLMIAY